MTNVMPEQRMESHQMSEQLTLQQLEPFLLKTADMHCGKMCSYTQRNKDRLGIESSESTKKGNF